MASNSRTRWPPPTGPPFPTSRATARCGCSWTRAPAYRSAFTASSNTSMTEWNIQSRAHACAACGKQFADQETYHTLLFDEKADFRRSDICAACWQQQYSQGARERKGFVSYWHGVYEAPPPPSDPIKRE